MGVVGVAAAPTASALQLTIENKNPNYNNDNVYVEFENINAQGVASRTPYKLSQLPQPIQVNSAAGRFFISFGAPLDISKGPDFINSGSPDYKTRWDKVEWTVNNNDFDCADLTAADFVGLPLQISNGNTTLGWRANFGTVLSTLAGIAGNDPLAVVKGDGPNGFIRVISPSTVPFTSTFAYPSWTDYINKMKTTTMPRVAGNFFGNGGGTYDFTASIDANGSVVMDGTAQGQHKNIVIPGDYLVGSNNLYRCDPKFTVDGQPWDMGKNDACCAAVRDLYTGFHYGFLGSTVTNPNNGQPLGAGPTGSWLQDSNNRFTPVPKDKLFSGAGPFYNKYAAYIASVSDAYGFPFSDMSDKTLLWLKDTRQLKVTVLAD